LKQTIEDLAHELDDEFEGMPVNAGGMVYILDRYIDWKLNDLAVKAAEAVLVKGEG
jgi:hypothetical protein